MPKIPGYNTISLKPCSNLFTDAMASINKSQLQAYGFDLLKSMIIFIPKSGLKKKAYFQFVYLCGCNACRDAYNCDSIHMAIHEQI